MTLTRVALATALALGGCAGVPARPRVPFPTEYVAPTDDAYQRWYERMRDGRVLERLAGTLAFLRLPVPLTLRLDQCGESNAWYDGDEHVATFCYEWLDELVRDSPSRVDEDGITREATIVGPVIFLYLHEIGHAVIDILKLPVLGREEDAADQLATMILLRLDPHGADGTLGAAARMFARSAKGQVPDASDLADPHPLDGQRYYNLLCLAYGSHPADHAEAAGGDDVLPPDRAEECEREYQQVAHAVRELLHFAPEPERP